MKRREFLKAAAASVLFSIVGITPTPSTAYKSTAKYGMVIDLTKCIGCGACVVACSLENTRYTGRTIPLGARTNFYFVNVKDTQLPYHKICMHCENPVCTRVCPTGATYKSPEGPVLVDYSRCIRCRYCIYECPFEPNVRYINEELHAVDKCTLCYHRITKGLNPACVEACPVGARVAGDISDAKSEISKIILDPSKNVVRVGEEAGIGPNLYFVLPEGITLKDLGWPKISFGKPIPNEFTLFLKTLVAPALEAAGLAAVVLGGVHMIRERRGGH